ncbi:MAG: hypothetical protein KKE17_09895 [Proteobacteria bacterium]|nr:hypothetical protein [Pseudomonadota bacterium]MBU1710304.1 hypothetical protein [Pseudomonadota bacterium]
MQKKDLLLIILAIFLAVAIFLTIIFGGGRSRHGYGSWFHQQSVTHTA